MNKIITTVLTTSLLFAGINNALADEATTKVDPSDLTKVNTAVSISMANNGASKLTGSLGFGYKNGQMGMTTLEGQLDDEGRYSDSRLQYFHVFNIGGDVIPRAALSIDIIDNQSFTTAAAGGLAMFQTPMESLTFYGRAAVLGGQYKDDFADYMGESNTDIFGGMGAAYAVWKPGSDGSYFYISPEYTYLGGDIETTTTKITLFAATPMSADGKHWGQLKFESSDISMKSNTKNEGGTDNVVSIAYKVFF